MNVAALSDAEGDGVAITSQPPGEKAIDVGA
jgi:hypothetical protein